MLVGVIAVFVLPDMPFNARGFSKEERELAMQRMVRFSLSSFLPCALSLLWLPHVDQGVGVQPFPLWLPLRPLDVDSLLRCAFSLPSFL
jgi:hypothetical protein